MDPGYLRFAYRAPRVECVMTREGLRKIFVRNYGTVLLVVAMREFACGVF